jgi:hypothetical protein
MKPVWIKIRDTLSQKKKKKTGHVGPGGRGKRGQMEKNWAKV